MRAHAYNLSTGEEEAGGPPRVQGSLGYKAHSSQGSKARSAAKQKTKESGVQQCMAYPLVDQEFKAIF